MRYNIIIQQAGAYKNNWDKFRSIPGHKFVLITDEHSVDKICAANQRDVFEKLLICEDFSTKHLKGLLDIVIYSLEITRVDSQSIRLATTFESDLLTVAKLREHFNIPGDTVATIRAFRDKLVMKSVVAKSESRSLPKYTAFNNEAYKANPRAYCDQCIQQLGLPIFAKPIAEAGSLDTAKIDTLMDLNLWFLEHQEETDYELDEFISGTLYHCDSFFQNGELLHCQIGEDLIPEAESLSGKAMGTIVLPEASPLFQEIKAFNERILRQFPTIPNGCTHLELFRTNDNRLIFVEVAARPPGGLIPEMYARYTGLDLREIHYKLQLDLPVQLTVNKGEYAAWAYFIRKPGAIEQFNSPVHFKSEYRLYWKYNVGDVLKKAKDDADCVGTLFFYHSDYETLKSDFESLRDFVPVNMRLLNASKTLLTAYNPNLSNNTLQPEGVEMESKPPSLQP